MKQIGNYNVIFYYDCNYDENCKKWHLLDLSEWDGEKLVKQNFLYIADENLSWVEKTLKSELTLTQLINFDKYRKITIESKWLYLIKK